MDSRDYPDLENFMSTWFNNSFDFSELDDVLRNMVKLGAYDNLHCLAKEVRTIEEKNIDLDEVNEFFSSIDARKLDLKRFVIFKKKIIEAAESLE